VTAELFVYGTAIYRDEMEAKEPRTTDEQGSCRMCRQGLQIDGRHARSVMKCRRLAKHLHSSCK
jgi:hypothetical protein